MPALIPAPPPFATASVSGTVSTAAQVFGGIKSLNSILGLAQYATGALPAAASYEGHIAYDSTLNQFVYSNGAAWVAPSGGAVSIGDSIGSATQGSILFAGAAGVLAQDNANLFWDDSNNRLGIGVATPSYKFQVDHTATSRAQIAGTTSMSNITSLSRHASLTYGGGLSLSTNLDTQAVVLAGDPLTGAAGLSFVAQTFENIRDNTPIGATTGINGGTLVSLLYSGGRWEHTPSNAGAIETLTEGIAYGAKYAMTVARNATDARSNSILKLLPTFNQGGSNSSHTVNVFEVDTVNTAVTGTTINLAKFSYGAAERFAFGSAGDLLVGGSAGTSGYILQSNGAGAAPTWVAAGGVGAMTIGGSITSATEGSVLFAGAAGVLAQDNAKFFWDNSNDRLGIGTATPDKALDITTSVNGSALLRVQNTSASGFSSATFHNSLTTKTISIGCGNASASSPYTDANYIDWDSSNLHFIGRVAAAATVVAQFSLTGLLTTRLGLNISETTGEIQMGGSAGTSGHVLTSQGAGARPVWGAAPISIGSTVTSGTTGSILFVGAGPVLAQDNAKLFWDDGNDRLGVGNAIPAESVDITGAVKVSTYVKIGANTIGYAAAAPVAGTWAQGDIVYNTGATAGASVGWVCTVAGSPGTWKEFGPISL